MELQMKLSAIILVVCLCLQVNATFEPAVQKAGEDGRIVPCKDLPKNLKNDCVTYSCDPIDGSVAVLGCSVANIRCKAGQVPSSTPEDLTKQYPGCCPKAVCRPA